MKLIKTMKLYNCLLLFFLGTALFSCGNNSGEKKSDFSLKFNSENNEFQLGDAIQVNLENKKERTVDSVIYHLQGERIQKTSSGETLNHTFRDEKLGKWNVTARIYSEGEQEEIQKEFTLYNNEPPASYTYRIIATYPHAPDAYTQGLEFHNDTLYESTGQYGNSSLRKVDLQTGSVIDSKKLDASYFAEGLTILDGKIYQLTWREGEGFIYDANSLEKTGSFAYNQSKEGWGLANDGEKLYKSDGTEKIWFLNPETLREEDFIQTVTHRTISTQLNELEWIDGKIYANTYQKDGVAIINPENGAIEGLINFKGLRDNLTNADDLDPVNDVLNGIAYNPNTDKIYVTGKNWDKLFEVEIIKR